MPVDFLKVLAEKKNFVWPELQSYLPKDGCLHSRMIRDYPERGGKYVRSGLVMLACEAFGGDPKKAIKTAAAMEASQNWILIHDDIEDDSDDRRGKPTLHKMYGSELAINAGDALHVLQWKMLADNRQVLGDAMMCKVLNEFYSILERTTLGQTIEMEWIKSNNFNFTEKDYYVISDSKTGLYTITGPMRLGAIIAGAQEHEMVALGKFGIPFGRAFQIQDDVLNLTAEQAKYGKEIGGDILEGKRTLMVAHLLANTDGHEKQKVIEIFSKPRQQKTQEETKWVLDMMRRKGSIDFGKRKSLEFAREAEQIFDREMGFLKDSPAKEALRAGIEFVVKRDL
ncbi:MAG: polyprenyl synthetase family protein [Candidatus Aenigmatarchaeota archaeon]